MICKECGYRNKYRKDEAKYCANCGAPLYEQIETKRREPRTSIKRSKKSRKNKNLQKAANTLRTKWIGYGAALLFGSFLIYLLVLPNERNPDLGNGKIIEEKSGNPFVEAKVVDLASQFACACGGCDEDPLDKCQCDYAIEERSFIRSRLENSVSDEEIIEALNKKYGGLKGKLELL
ncbi:MAG: hypothetical protein GXO87_05785 [Chlorobi bacterium]|nr:hypothetical protein [Chlorobiota bacterium]